VSVADTNAGARPGSDVPQLYLGLPQPAPGVTQPPEQLRGMQKLSLAPGQAARASFPLDARSFAYWSTQDSAWRIAPGCYGVFVGHSSRDIAEHATIAVGGAACPGAILSLPIAAGYSASTGRAASRCVSGRSILIHFFHHLHRRSVRRVTVTINGHRQRVLRGPRTSVRVPLKGRPGGVTRVRVTIRLTSGRVITVRHTFHLCRPRITHRPRKSHRPTKKTHR
jgi:beta-glucosidase